MNTMLAIAWIAGWAILFGGVAYWFGTSPWVQRWLAQRRANATRTPKGRLREFRGER